MVRTEALDRRTTLVVDVASLSKRRERLRRRRRRDTLREWAAVCVTATAALWLASIAVLGLVAR